MKQCGDDWKAAKANNSTNGLTWPQFLKQCRTGKEGAATPAAAPAPLPARSRSSRAGPGAILSAEAEAHAGGSSDRRREFLRRPKPRPAAQATGGLGQHEGQVPHLSLLRQRVGTGRPSRAPTCARPTLGRQVITRRRAGPNSRSRCRWDGRLRPRGRICGRGRPPVEKTGVRSGRPWTAPPGTRRAADPPALFLVEGDQGRQSGSCALSANWVKRRRL